MSNSTEPSPRLFKKLKKKLVSLFASKKAVSLEDSVNKIIQEQSVIDSVHAEEKNILENLVDFGELHSSDVMINRTDIIAAPINITFNELTKLFAREAHSRVPIYKTNLDEIEGFIHVKDVLKESLSRKKGGRIDVKSMIRDILFVPETMRLPDLLTRMKATQIQMAIVLDEHGGTVGLLSIEDVMEALVGDIHDEHDLKESISHIVEEQSGVFTINALAEMPEVETALGMQLVEDLDEVEYDTFGGFVITYLGHIPKVGETFEHPLGFKVEVAEANSRKVKVLKVSKSL